MNCFRIDLNKLEDPALARRKERRQNLLFLGLGLLFLGVAACVYALDRSLDSRLRELRSARSGLAAELETLESGATYLAEDDVRALHELVEQRIFWSRKLEDLSRITGDKVALTHVAYGDEGLFIKGVSELPEGANRFDRVTAFIDSLKASEEFARDFGKVEFKSSSRQPLMDKEILAFEVLCLPK